jgi:hypothetical protein
MSIFTNPKFKVLKTDGTLAASYKVYFFETGTSTPKDTYPTAADAAAMTNANDNPVILDSNGEAEIWPTTGQYRIRVDSDGDVTQTGYPIDAIQGAGTTLGAGEDLTLSSTSDIIVNTNKFTVAGATGNTVIDGTLAANSTITVGDDIQLPNAKSIAFRNVGNTSYYDVLSFNTSNDTVIDTGPTDDVIINAGGSEVMRVANNDRVGIGTNAPGEKLEVQGSGTDNTNISIDSGGNASLIIDNGGASYNSQISFQESASTQYSIYYQGAANELVFFDNANSNQDLTISSGNVGINTDTPTSLLHGYSDNSSTTPMCLLEQDGIGDSGISFLLTSGQQMTMGIDNSDSDTFKISDSGVLGTNDRFSIDTSGNIGIGTSTPAKLLDVVGTSASLLEGLQLTNNDWGTGETTQSLAINFKLSQGGTTETDAGRITVGKDDDWDDVAASDSYMSFKTKLSGSLNEQMRIDSEGKSTFKTSSTSTASINLPHGAAPSSPVSGDMWTTTAGLYVYINGVTVGPLT